MRSEIAENLNVLEFVKIFGEICKTLGVRWSNRYGVTAKIEYSSEFDLAKLYNSQVISNNENDDDDEELSSSPFGINCTIYYTTQDMSTLSPTNIHFSTLNQNCQSLSAHWDNFKNQLEQIQNHSLQFDIISLTETFRLASPEHYSLTGYHPIISRARPPDDDNRGGVGLYFKTKVSYQITLFCDISTIGVIYRANTPPRADLDMYLQTLQDILIQLNSVNKTVYIMGDFNIDLLKFKNHKKLKLSLTLCSHTATYHLYLNLLE